MVVEAEHRTSLVLERKTRSLEHLLLSSIRIHQLELEDMVVEDWVIRKEKSDDFVLVKEKVFLVRHETEKLMVRRENSDSVSKEAFCDGFLCLVMVGFGEEEEFELYGEG
ncbi:unnamed protein product [Thlaspi arvense]|uniref:Uncharacterized protein n=1 Tax=Thlaspi arvense TaxID=13288 RepID=A0AAU9S8U9_THLAR|nr:unnamed protein product [Thlaspi arvense]